jgi:hypothetical protein
MKLTDFVKGMNETLKVNIPAETLTTLESVELPDEFGTKFKEIYISKERAKNDSEIIDHVVKEERRNIFGVFDKKSETFMSLLADEDKEEISKTFQTYEKYSKLAAALEKSFKANKGKSSEEVQKIQEELTTKIKAQTDLLKQKEEEWSAKFEDTQFEFTIKDLIKSYNLADAYKAKVDSITKLAIIDFKEKPYKYKLENGKYAILKEKDGIQSYAFEEGTENKLTLEKQLDKFMDDFTAKSTGGAGGEPVNGKPKPTPTPTPTPGATSLAERRRMDAARV